jgi:hypothetical protein
LFKPLQQGIEFITVEKILAHSHHSEKEQAEIEVYLIEHYEQKNDTGND